MYGQGMSVAAVEAMTLRDQLERGFDALRFFRAVRPVIDIPWQIATGGDLNFPGVKGPRPAMVRFINPYLGRLYAAAEYDVEVSAAFIRVANLLAPPSSLLSPRIAAAGPPGPAGRGASGGPGGALSPRGTHPRGCDKPRCVVGRAAGYGQRGR